MTTDWKALCAELIQELKSANEDIGLINEPRANLINRADAALSKPEPEGPTSGELRQIFNDHSGCINDQQVMWCGDFCTAARAVIARWGRPVPQPSALAQPEPERPTDDAELHALCARMADELDYYRISKEGDDRSHPLTREARAVLARWGRPAPPPATGELAELVAWLRMYGATGRKVLDQTPWTASQLDRAADLLKRLDHYEKALSAVMPPDFKDWWQNSKDEWPDVAAGVIENLRKREELAWEQLDRVTASFH